VAEAVHNHFLAISNMNVPGSDLTAPARAVLLRAKVSDFAMMLAFLALIGGGFSTIEDTTAPLLKRLHGFVAGIAGIVANDRTATLAAILEATAALFVMLGAASVRVFTRMSSKRQESQNYQPAQNILHDKDPLKRNQKR
jgi:hypothetical protein